MPLLGQRNKKLVLRNAIVSEGWTVTRETSTRSDEFDQRVGFFYLVIFRLNGHLCYVSSNTIRRENKHSGGGLSRVGVPFVHGGYYEKREGVWL